MRIAVVTDDRLGPAMAGSAVRAWEISRVLADADHDVEIVAAAGSEPPAPNGPRVVERPSTIRPDAVVSPPWCAPLGLLLGARRVVIDGVTPLLAELAAAAEHDPVVVRRRRTASARLEIAGARSDAVLVAGEAQRRWWQARLRRSRVALVDLPFGLPDADARGDAAAIPGVPPSWKVIVWWGGVWPWLDLDTLLAARTLLESAPVSVVVPTADRPGGGMHTLTSTTLMQRAEAHGLKPPQVVALERWVPYAERDRMLARAAVVAVLHHPGAETELSFRTRALDGVWAGVPLLLTDGGAISELARARGWGAVVPPHDPRATAAAIELLLGDRTRSRCREAMDRDRDVWRWSRVAQPLVELLPVLPRAPRGGLLAAALRAALRLRTTPEGTA
jgi:glycosyltransferase involved in cell wall biosynthesis